jgi:hypothetical protein
MIQTIWFSQFCDAFHSINRSEHYSYKAKKAIFNHLEEYEDSIGEQTELNIIEICCEYTEYPSLEELQKYHSNIESFDDLESETTVLYTEKYQDESAPFVIIDF